MRRPPRLLLLAAGRRHLPLQRELVLPRRRLPRQGLPGRHVVRGGLSLPGPLPGEHEPGAGGRHHPPHIRHLGLDLLRLPLLRLGPPGPCLLPAGPIQHLCVPPGLPPGRALPTQGLRHASAAVRARLNSFLLVLNRRGSG